MNALRNVAMAAMAVILMPPIGSAPAAAQTPLPPGATVYIINLKDGVPHVPVMSTPITITLK